MIQNLHKERYVNVTTMIRYHNDKMVEAFVRFTRFSVGVGAGGIGYLFLNENTREVKDIVLATMPILLWIVGISSIAVILSNWKSWFGFRKAESKILDMPCLYPRLPRAFTEQFIMLGVIVIVCLIFTMFCIWILPESI